MPIGGKPSTVLARSDKWVATSSESRRQGGGGDVPRRLAQIHCCELESRAFPAAMPGRRVRKNRLIV